MLEAWTAGDVPTLGAIFRADGRGLRDLYRISGPELESICDAVRTVPGVYGERMLGGGDKGASGALVAADAIDWLNAHGSGTRASDAAEAKALHAVFGGRMPIVSGSKGALGHALGASSALELAICVQGLREQCVPVTAGFQEMDTELGIACTRVSTQRELRYVLNNAFAFGGLNSSVLLKRWES